MLKQMLLIVVVHALQVPGPAMAVDLVGGMLGHGDEDTDRYGLMAGWDWDSRWFEAGQWYLGGYWEADISHWTGDAGKTGKDQVNAIGLTPVFRLQTHTPHDGIRPFLEAGVGIHALSGTRLGHKRLSSSLQFRDLVGIGLQAGDRQQYEIGYRFSHFSNAGIKQPNPGVNFHMLRLGYRPE